jgi:WD40 repeat protein
LRLYNGLCSSSSAISAVCLDGGKKKIVIGDTDGNIQVINYSNGAVLRRLDPHKSVVSQLIYCNDSKSIISASWDTMINIHDELDSNKKGRSTLRTISGYNMAFYFLTVLDTKKML